MKEIIIEGSPKDVRKIIHNFILKYGKISVEELIEKEGKDGRLGLC